MTARVFPLLLALVGPLITAFAADPRGDAPDAPPSTAEEERRMFHLPPGFEIQLVADESQIQKPMNLAFDALGRVWVTGSALYPFAARTDALGHPIDTFDREWSTMSGSIGREKPEPPPAPIDTVRVLSDFGPDGRARKVETFADGLNVPIGIQPLARKPEAKGDTIIVYSIPNIWRMEDTDGDGRADVREPLYTGFGFRDTHGMSSNYLYWVDGWIYGCHGFANHSEVRDRDGKVTILDSGNTYRFRPDGSAFEIYTHGQTNPFGLTVDEYGNFYSADSHSKPAYLLIPGGYYEGIGKKHDGLGFAPAIMQHNHGSSAIAGIACYTDDKWPEEYRGNLFIGNPVTRRINRDRLEWTPATGSTPQAIEMPDFLTCDDPWFRPVQVKLGPDGALWIADFYNAVIGHYEFPLLDPRRDHQHGRIWRIVWRGAAASTPPPFVIERSEITDELLTRQLQESSLVKRILAVLELEAKGKEPKQSVIVKSERSAAQLLTRLRDVPDLLKAWSWDAPALTYAIEVALRDRMLVPGTLTASVAKLGFEDSGWLTRVALAVHTEESAEFLLAHLQHSKFSNREAGAELGHVIRFLPVERFGALEKLVLDSFQELDDLLLVAASVLPAVRERGGTQLTLLVERSEQALLRSLRFHDAVSQRDAIAALRDSLNPAKFEPLLDIVNSKTEQAERLRVSALEAMANLPEATPVLLHSLSGDTPSDLQRKAAELLSAKLGTDSAGDSANALVAALATAPTDTAQVIATGLAKHDAECALLLTAIESGKASPRLLRQKAVAAALANRPADLRDRAAALTKDLPPEDARLDAVIARRVEAFRQAKPDLTKGKALFQQHCAVCHKFRGEGGSVAPNLDGVGPARGVHRLAEDILDPNRNVDGTFRQVILETTTGQLYAGVNLRETPTALTLTDATGKDVTVTRLDLKSQTVSPLSLMPPAFEQSIAEPDFSDLLAFLLQP